MSNNELIARIKSGDPKALEKLYADYRTEFIQWGISVNHAEAEDAKDVYQQSVIILYENIVNGRLIEMKSNMKTYLFAIGKNKFAELNRKKKHTMAITPENSVDVTDTEDLSSEKTDQLILLSKKALEKLGAPCKTLLELYYYHKRTMSEIAQSLGYKNEDSAKNQKYKCLNRLKEIFFQDIRSYKIAWHD